MQTCYPNTATALNTTMDKIYEAPVKKFQVFTTWGFL